MRFYDSIVGFEASLSRLHLFSIVFDDPIRVVVAIKLIKIYLLGIVVLLLGKGSAFLRLSKVVR